MATKQITTWDEFKTALTETITENTTYEIMNDIDVSGEVIAESITIWGSSSYKKTVNGNNYEINGLTTYSLSTIFTISNTNIEFINLHFSNMMIPNARLLGTINSNHVTFTKCLFNGIINSFSYCTVSSSSVTNSNRYLVFDMCSINIDCIRLVDNQYSYQYAYFTNCYIILSRKSNRTQGTNIFSTWSVFNNCYIGGEYKYNGIVDFGYYSRNVKFYTNCVININLFANSCYFGYADTSLFNSDKLKNYSGTDSITPTSQYSTWYGLTDTQLKSKTYIQENTNFPLYG